MSAGARRVLLIRPFCNRRSTIIMPPLGMMYLAAYLRRRGDVGVRIVDMPVADLAYEDLAGVIRDYRPDLVGISALNFESDGLHRIAAAAKSCRPGVPVVAGGPYPSAYTELVMADPHVDHAVVGEGELPLDELVRALPGRRGLEAIGGLARREGGRVRVVPRERYVEDLDALPLPAWDLVDVGAYRRRYDRMSRTGVGDYMPLFTSRSCPYRCIYCHNVFGRKFRVRSPDGVLGEIRALHARYGIREFEIVDDCFNFDLDRAKAIFRGLVHAGPRVQLTLPAAVRGDRLDEEFFALGRRAGLVFLAFAVETASPRLQRMIRKDLDLDAVERNVALARKHGIFCQGFFMLGFPTETRAELRATIDFACRSELHAAVFLVVTAFEDSGLAELARQVGKPVYAHFDHNYMSREFTNLTNLPDREFQRLRRAATVRFWLDPKRALAFVRDYPHKSRLLHLAAVMARRLLQWE